MGGNSNKSGGDKSGGNKGGNKPAKKAAPKKSNGTSKYFKKTSTPAPKAKKKRSSNRAGHNATRKNTPKVVKKTPVVNAGSPHERNRDLVRPATPIKSTAKTTPNTDNKITKTKVPLAKVVSAPPMDIMSAREGEKERFTSPTSPTPAAVKPKDKATPKGGKGHLNSIKGLNDPKSHKALLGAYQGYDKPRDNFNADTYKAKAEEGRNSEAYGVGDIIKDKYRNDEVSYNQAYWKAKKEGGATQAEMAAEQKALGSKKIYSGDRAITENDQRKSKYILDSLLESGIKSTDTTKKSGLFGERETTTSSYDIGTGKPVISTTEKYSPTLGGMRFGDDVTKTYVNGVDTWTEKGVGDDSSITTSKTGAQNDRVEAGPDAVKEIADIDSQIKTETDPVKLKALHKRRLMLMRLNNTNTRFAGLLDDADTKRSNLMSIG